MTDPEEKKEAKADAGGAAGADAKAGEGEKKDEAKAGSGDGEKKKEATEKPKAMPSVARSFTMGWQMAQLFRRPAHMSPASDDAHEADGLPGLSDLGDGTRAEIALLEIAATLHSLKDDFKAAEVEPPSTAEVQEAMRGRGSNDPIRNEVHELHIAVLGRLTAIDFRLGKAYGLGRALAETCAVTDLASLKQGFGEFRVAQISEWLADLTTVLPEHSGRATQISLAWWKQWVEQQDEEKWDAGGARAKRALTRQGRLWRALLSGEKDGVDMLDIEDYTEAADRLVVQGKGVVKKLLGRYERYLWSLSAIVFVLVVLAIWQENVNSAVVALAAAAGALGVSWKGIGSLLADLGEKLRKPLWGAELDYAIAVAITLPPIADEVPIGSGIPSPIGPTLTSPPATPPPAAGG